MRIALHLMSFLLIGLLPIHAETQIDWTSSQDATNVTSNDITPMDGDFRFELGVFETGFTPTAGNLSQWVANWHPVQRTAYRTDIRRYAASFTVIGNTAPFTVGAPAYVWGFKGDPAAGQWILFRANDWTWPSGGNGPPEFRQWRAVDATAVLGTIHASGSPALMTSAAVGELAPPTIDYDRWVTAEMGGETLVGTRDDADGDGNPNILEFITGSSPTVVGPQILFPTALVDVSGSRYLQITVPRRVDRPAAVTVQVSSDLTNWFSGSSNTLVVSSSNFSLIVRDLTPVSPSAPRRFIRVQATTP